MSSINQSHNTILKDIFLAGGGHAHALVIKKYAMNPWPGVRLNLISDCYQTPYSGMLPGLVAGDYHFDEAHIDLARLCQWSQVRFFHGKIKDIDFSLQTVISDEHPPLHWDIISINTGSTPSLPEAPGFKEFSTPIKPITHFLSRLKSFIKQLQSNTLPDPSVFILGAGVAGIEIAFSLRARFSKLSPKQKVKIQIIHSKNQVLPELSGSARKLMEKELAKSDIVITYNTKVEHLTADSITLQGHANFPCQLCIVCSHAQAPHWPSKSGLKVDENGFILVNQNLQSISHPAVFAAGDIAQVSGQPLPRAGVYAVRQAEPLATNLLRAISHQSLIKFKPQKSFLKLIGTGNGKALAAKGAVHFYGKTPWKLKRSIDQKFMQKLGPDSTWLSDMQERKPPAKYSLTLQTEHAKTLALASMRCSGCAAKWDEGVLSDILNSIRSNPKLRICLTSPDDPQIFLKPDDAAVFTPVPGFDMAQSIDFMPCITSDPYLFGRILVNHSFNDIYAMGGKPHSAQALIMLPYAAKKIAASDGKLLMQGIATQLIKLGSEIKLIGGHTCEGSPMSAGIVCNGLVKPGSSLSKAGLTAGDKLILSKPLGTGVIFAAAMRLAAHSQWLDSAINSMLVDHSFMSEPHAKFPGGGATDISGFGLLGHLLEMQFMSNKNVILYLDQIPLLPGVEDCLAMGIRSSLYPKNATKKKFIHMSCQIDDPKHEILFDPQTSGPMLLSLPAQYAPVYLEMLKNFGFLSSAIIGEVSDEWTPNTPTHIV
ncbi:MAG: selenide, water dikinase SelD [Oligoflexales bacterium]